MGLNRWVTQAAVVGLAGAAAGFAAARLIEKPDALGLLTFALVIVTIYYAVQTRQMVVEMRTDRAAALAREDRDRAAPILLTLLEELDKTIDAMSVPYLDHFTKIVARQGSALRDERLRERLDSASVACQTLAHHRIPDVEAATLVVRLLLEDLRPAVVAALRDEPAPSPARAVARASVQAAVYDAKKTLAEWA